MRLYLQHKQWWQWRYTGAHNSWHSPWCHQTCPLVSTVTLILTLGNMVTLQKLGYKERDSYPWRTKFSTWRRSYKGLVVHQFFKYWIHDFLHTTLDSVFVCHLNIHTFGHTQRLLRHEIPLLSCKLSGIPSPIASLVTSVWYET